MPGLVIDGAQLQVIPLPGSGMFTVGRSQNCDVSIDSWAVARHHANLKIRADRRRRTVEQGYP